MPIHTHEYNLYVYIHNPMPTHIICAHAPIHGHVHVHVHTGTRMNSIHCTYTSTYTNTRTHIGTCTYRCPYSHTHTHTNIYTHTYIRAHIHTILHTGRDRQAGKPKRRTYGHTDRRTEGHTYIDTDIQVETDRQRQTVKGTYMPEYILIQQHTYTFYRYAFIHTSRYTRKPIQLSCRLWQVLVSTCTRVSTYSHSCALPFTLKRPRLHTMNFAPEVAYAPQAPTSNEHELYTQALST